MSSRKRSAAPAAQANIRRRVAAPAAGPFSLDAMEATLSSVAATAMDVDRYLAWDKDQKTADGKPREPFLDYIVVPRVRLEALANAAQEDADRLTAMAAVMRTIAARHSRTDAQDLALRVLSNPLFLDRICDHLPVSARSTRLILRLVHSSVAASLIRAHRMNSIVVSVSLKKDYASIGRTAASLGKRGLVYLDARSVRITFGRMTTRLDAQHFPLIQAAINGFLEWRAPNATSVTLVDCLGKLNSIASNVFTAPRPVFLSDVEAGSIMVHLPPLVKYSKSSHVVIDGSALRGSEAQIWLRNVLRSPKAYPHLQELSLVNGNMDDLVRLFEDDTAPLPRNDFVLHFTAPGGRSDAVIQRKVNLIASVLASFAQLVVHVKPNTTFAYWFLKRTFERYPPGHKQVVFLVLDVAAENRLPLGYISHLARSTTLCVAVDGFRSLDHTLPVAELCTLDKPILFDVDTDGVEIVVPPPATVHVSRVEIGRTIPNNIQFVSTPMTALSARVAELAATRQYGEMRHPIAVAASGGGAVMSSSSDPRP